MINRGLVLSILWYELPIPQHCGDATLASGVVSSNTPASVFLFPLPPQPFYCWLPKTVSYDAMVVSGRSKQKCDQDDSCL